MAIIQKSILGGRVLKFSEQVVAGSEDFSVRGFVNFNPVLASSMCKPLDEVVKPPRKIPKIPYRILDAPGLQDDFYLNLVDWSAQNVLAVALESAVYVWNATTSTVSELFDLAGTGDSVTSLSWSAKGDHLGVGTRSG